MKHVVLLTFWPPPRGCNFLAHCVKSSQVQTRLSHDCHYPARLFERKMNKQEPVLDAASLTKYVITEQKINFYEAGKFENREHPTHASIVKRN